MRTYVQYLSTSRGGGITRSTGRRYTTSWCSGENYDRRSIWIAEREKGGLFQPGDTFPKTGQPVLGVFPLKHPEVCPPTVQILQSYGGKPPAMVPVDITDAEVETVAQQLLGSVGPGGVDSINLQHWLLRFGWRVWDYGRLLGSSVTGWPMVSHPCRPTGH